jgi:CRISPR-associated protein Csx10
VTNLTITAHTDQPLLLGVRPTGTAPGETYRYVPGSVLRGALAGAWIRENGLPDGRPEFLDLFERAVLYGPLLPAGSAIVPVSVLRCKYNECKDVVDQAFPDAPSDSEATRRWACTCGPLVASRGGIDVPSELTTQSTHVQIDPSSGTAQEGKLFTRRGLAVGHELTGTIRLGTSTPAARAWLTDVCELRLGGRRGTSGAVTITVVPDVDAPPPNPTRRLVLVTQAPTILTDASGLPLDLTDPAPFTEALQAEAGSVLGVRVTGARVWARTETVGGWHAASRLPKPNELALVPGSVLRLDLDQEPTVEALAVLLDRGLGLRRAEGFGVVEQRTTAWTAAERVSTSSEPQAVAGDDAKVREVVDRIMRTGRGAWFVDQLRTYVSELSAHSGPGRPEAALLDRRVFRELPDQDRELLTLAVREFDVGLLDRIYGRLEATVRIAEEEAR